MRQYDFGKASNSSTLWNSATPDSKEHERVLSSKQPAAVARLRKSTSGIARQSSLLQLQREQGNRYVQRVLALARSTEGDGNVMPDVERAIESSRGGGNRLIAALRRRWGAPSTPISAACGAHRRRRRRLESIAQRQAFTTGQRYLLPAGRIQPGEFGRPRVVGA